MAGLFTRAAERGIRYVEDGYDLDLSYIKPRIIAISFPVRRLESASSKNEISRFLEDKYRGHYKIYNLCTESYDTSRFQQRVTRFPVDIHSPPPFKLIQMFCQDMDEWLDADDENVAIVHCGDGLGRTGTMVCSYLLHNGAFDSAKEVLQFFGEARAQNKEGVSVPSQRRYVQYCEYLLKNKLQYCPKVALLRSFKLICIPSGLGGTFTPYFTITLRKFKVYTSQLYTNIKQTDTYVELHLPREIQIYGDVKVEFFHQSFIGQKEKLFTIWFNTFFINQQKQKVVRSITLPPENKRFPPSLGLSENTGKERYLNKKKGFFSSVLSEESRIKSLSFSNLTTTDDDSVFNKNHCRSLECLTDPKCQPEKLMYKNNAMQMTMKQLKKALRTAGKKAGVDITTGCTRYLKKSSISAPILKGYQHYFIQATPSAQETERDGSNKGMYVYLLFNPQLTFS